MKIRNILSEVFCGIGILCGYIALFFGALRIDRWCCRIMIIMVACIYIGILLSDYFLNSFKK
jgi:hypothetical protein